MSAPRPRISDRRTATVLFLSLLVLPVVLHAQPLIAPPGYESLAALMSSDEDTRTKVAKKLKRSKDESLVPGLVDGLFFAPKAARPQLYEILEALTGETPERTYYAWVEYLGATTDLQPKPGYEEWKRRLFARIDDTYLRMLDPALPRRIRLEEVVWGGVKLDGIPSLDAPPMLSAEQATYLRDDETVYGLDLGGEQRAYPDRALSWHELTNDRVGGRPIAIVYCTLCGSAIAFDTARTEGGAHEGGAYELGTSGLLFRSNKLMFDRGTLTLWNSMTGKPVVGTLASREIELAVLPMTRTRWADWKRRHPRTLAMALDPQLGSRYGYVYEPGAADRRRTGVTFPVWQKSERLARQEEIYGLRLGEAAKAYPLTAIYAERVVNDVLAGQPIVLVADPEAGAVRAYHRGAHSFSAGNSSGEVRDTSGRIWRLGESELRLAGTTDAETETADRLERVPGHVAYWFGWFGFFPRTEVYGEP